MTQMMIMWPIFISTTNHICQLSQNLTWQKEKTFCYKPQMAEASDLRFLKDVSQEDKFPEYNGYLTQWDGEHATNDQGDILTSYWSYSFWTWHYDRILDESTASNSFHRIRICCGLCWSTAVMNGFACGLEWTCSFQKCVLMPWRDACSHELH